jgi:P pilus assembly chaperone PapD
MLSTPLFTGKQRVLSIVSLLVVISLAQAALIDSARAATKSLMLSPVRVIFTDRQRSADVHVINPSQESITYAISTVTMRKDAKGDLREVTNETEAERTIKNMIRFSPRRATIEPGKRQVVKLMVNKPNDLPPGEYQIRLRLSPQPNAPKTAETNLPQHGGSRIALELIVDSTFPIIIQHGGIAAEVTPVALSVKQTAESPSGIAAEVKLSRSGNASAFGNVRLQYIPTNDPKAIREIGQAQGMAIYLPEAERAISIPLANISRQELGAGAIRVSYMSSTGSNTPRDALGQKSVKDFPLR